MTFPVSIKGVIFRNGQVILLKNEREEWELPGGRLEKGEDPRQCLTREIQEELGIKASVEHIVDSWLYPVLPNKEVLIVTYFCRLLDERSVLRISHEHKEVGLYGPGEIAALPIPQGYRLSILACMDHRCAA